MKEFYKRLKKIFKYLIVAKRLFGIILFSMLINALVCIYSLFYTQNIFELIKRLVPTILFIFIYIYSDLSIKKDKK